MAGSSTASANLQVGGDMAKLLRILNKVYDLLVLITAALKGMIDALRRR